MLGMFQIINPVLHPNLRGLTGSDPVGYFNYLLPNLITIGFVAAIVIFFFVFIVGAIAWITSGSDKAALENARRRIVSGLIGLIILLLIFFILQLMNRIFGLDIGNIGIGVAPTGITGVPPTLPPQPTLPPATGSCANTSVGVCSCSCPAGYIPAAGSCAIAVAPACVDNCVCDPYYNIYPQSNILWYGMNEGSGTTVGDSSGGGFLGSFSSTSGETWSTAGCGTGSLLFDGANGAIMSNLADDGVFLAPSFTLSAWVRIANPISTENIIIDNNNTAALLYTNQRYVRGYIDQVRPTCGTSRSVITSTRQLLSGQWYFIALTYSHITGEARIYIDGVVDITTTLPPPIYQSSGSWCDTASAIGTNSTGSVASDMIGNIDEVRIYNYAISDSDVTALFGLCTPRP